MSSSTLRPRLHTALTRPFEGISLRARLALTLAAAILLVAGALLLFLRLSVDSFEDYLANVDTALLKEAASALEQRHALESTGGWEFVHEPLAQWLMQIQSRALAGAASTLPLPPHAPPPRAGESHPPGPGMFQSRLVLRDANGAYVAGNAASATPLQRLPLRRDGQTIGSLELLPLEVDARMPARIPGIPGAGGFNTDEEGGNEALWRSEFFNQQLQLYGVLLASAVLAMLLLGLPLSNYLTRRIQGMVDAAQRLSEGDYGHRIAVQGGDELSRLSRSVNALAEALQRNRDAQRQWVSNISHELRTPLGVLKGELEAIQDGIRNASPDEIALLCGEVDQLSRLINDLFTLSMADLGTLDYRFAPVRIAGVLRDSAAAFADLLARGGLTLEVALESVESISLQADRQRLLQLFANLLANSLKYTQSPGLVRVRGCLLQDHVEIIVEDSSPGVSTQQLPRLFERLYRADASRSRSTGGAGLGLAICRSIAQAHQGSIEARHSQLGGLAQHVRLPLS